MVGKVVAMLRGGKIAALFLSLALSAAAESLPDSVATDVADTNPRTWYVVQDHSWAPLAFRDRHGEPQGLIVDLWKLIGTKTGRPVQFELLDWQHTLHRVKGSREAIHGGLLESPERRAYLDFSNPLFQLRTALFVNARSLRQVLEPADLTQPIGITAGGFEEEFMRKHHPALALRLYNNNRALVEAAVRGDVDAFVADYPVGMFYLDRFTTPDQFRVLSVLYSRPIHAAVARGNSASLDEINRALNDISPEEMTRLTQKWISHREVETLPPWLLALVVASVLLMGVSFLLYHNAVLNRRLAAQAAEIRAQEQQVTLLTDNMTDWVWMVNEQQAYTYISPSVKKLIGYEAGELVGRDMGCVLHPSDRERAYAQLAHILAAARRGEFHGYRDSITRFGLAHKDGHLVWVEAAVRMFFTPTGEFSGAQGSSRDISERKQAEDAIRQLALNDQLTQLPNRRLLYDRLQQICAGCARQHQHCAILFIDMDNFRYINDNYGHDDGDLLLQQIALRLASGVRESDTLARFNGDEFVVVSEHLSQDVETARQQALMIGLKLLDLFEREFYLRDQPCKVTASIGIVLFNDDSKAVNSLLKYADTAMHQAKVNGRNRCVISDQHHPGSLNA
ncbi:diguanylate cyclase domain-containing protein [Cellvibrio japonicus]|nr:diguanylate cyclase [Cellvibrio japonicus]